jgi:hypothetical protein
VGVVAGCSIDSARKASQGHLYHWRGNPVIAMEGGSFPRVVHIDPAWQWCSPPFNVQAADLVPMPMRYYGGNVP